MKPERWYIVRKNTVILIVDSDAIRDILDKKLLKTDNPDDYEVISLEEVYRRIKG